MPALEALWTVMDEGGFEPARRLRSSGSTARCSRTARRCRSIAQGIHELWVAARRDWKDVEPAIFGTLLEQALNPRERSKLGAHYTPRAYVERLVVPTIIEPLREPTGRTTQAAIGPRWSMPATRRGALEAARTFHHQLARRACSTPPAAPATSSMSRSS